MGKMIFLSESIPASSAVFWNQFRIESPKSFPESATESAQELIRGSAPELTPESELASKLKQASKDADFNLGKDSEN